MELNIFLTSEDLGILPSMMHKKVVVGCHWSIKLGGLQPAASPSHDLVKWAVGCQVVSSKTHVPHFRGYLEIKICNPQNNLSEVSCCSPARVLNSKSLRISWSSRSTGCLRRFLWAYNIKEALGERLKRYNSVLDHNIFSCVESVMVRESDWGLENLGWNFFPQSWNFLGDLG